MITWEAVAAIAPELADTEIATQDAILSEVDLLVKSARWGTRYDLACKYLAAHLGTVFARGATGQVQSESAAGVSRAYVTNPNGDEYDSTSYGKRYKGLRRVVFAGPRVT